MAAYIAEHFVPLRAHIKQRAVLFHRFDVLWTPTVLFLDSSGVERRRSEGYLPRDEFSAEVHHGEARVQFMRKRWADAERLYSGIVTRFGDTTAAPEAMYWRAVSRYKQTHDHAAFTELVEQFDRRNEKSVWARKAEAWRQ